MSEPEDQTLVVQVQAGDSAAFEALMRRYQRPVLNFVYRLLGDATEADDVTQEVFVRVYQNIGRYSPRTRFTTWLFAVARNASIDRLRWRRRHAAEPLATAPPLAAPAQGGVAEQASAREIGAQIAAAVARLPEDQRTAVVLSEYQGLSYGEVAQIMKCSAKSVEARLYRAKQTLRKSLAFLLEE